MVTQLTYSMVTLDPGQAHALPRRNIQTICALDQALWLSQQGRFDDFVVAGGDCITLHGRGLVVAQAFGERTTFRVAYAATRRDRLAALVRRCLRDGPTPRRAPWAFATERQRPFLSAVWPP